MKNLRWIVIAAAVIGIVAYLAWSRQQPDSQKNGKQQERSQPTDGKAGEREALEAFSKASSSSYSPTAHDPTPLELAVDLRQLSPETGGALLNAYRSNSSVFNNDETASLALALLLLNNNDLEGYKTLSKRWEGRTTRPNAWFVLDGDLLVAQGDKDAAIAHLKSKAFSGPQDIARVGRLALLLATTHPEQSLQALAQLEEANPGNPLIAILASRVLEKENRITEAAQKLSHPSGDKAQPQQAEALSDLFRRYGYSSYAAAALQSAGEKLSPEAEAQRLFWQRVLFTSLPTKGTNTNGDAYLEYLSTLPQGVFWNEQAFEALPNAQQIAATHQEAYWLRLLALLSSGQYDQALALLHNSPFKQTSWNPSLERALEAALNHRLTGTLTASPAPKHSTLEEEYGTTAWAQSEENPFVASLLKAAASPGSLTPDEQALLDGDDVFSAVLVGAGWQKAGRLLHKGDARGRQYPDWYSVELTKGIAEEKGPEAALKFAQGLPASPALTLEIAELYFANGKSEEGIKALEHLRTENNEAGARAAWISAQHYWRKGKLDVARQIIQSNAHLVETPMGQEALAIISSKQSKEPSKR